MGGLPTSDAVLEPRSAGLSGIRFRLGLQLRDPDEPPPSPLLPARYVRIQVASPPPARLDGTAWYEGLRVKGSKPDGSESLAEFLPDAPPVGLGVVPLLGISPLGRPEPGTLVLDQWLEVPVATFVPAGQSAPLNISIADSGDVVPDEVLHFLSVPYPRPRSKVDGRPLDVVRGAYYFGDGSEARAVSFQRSIRRAKEDKPTWIAVSLDRFWPPERASSDYIVAVTPD